MRREPSGVRGEPSQLEPVGDSRDEDVEQQHVDEDDGEAAGPGDPFGPAARDERTAAAKVQPTSSPIGAPIHPGTVSAK